MLKYLKEVESILNFSKLKGSKLLENINLKEKYKWQIYVISYLVYLLHNVVGTKDSFLNNLWDNKLLLLTYT